MTFGSTISTKIKDGTGHPNAVNCGKKSGRADMKLAEATAEDQRAAASLAQADKTATARADQLGRMIVAAAHRMNRIGDLATVLKAAARKEKDATAIAALTHSLLNTKDNA